MLIISILYSLLFICIIRAQAIDTESFQEELKIRPLRDGRVLSRFSFTTTLQNATPRPPELLREDDDRE